jgi:hypothetical protein
MRRSAPPNAPKVKALAVNLKVALTIDTEDFPPNILLVRGSAALETVDGVPDEFVEAARRFVGDDAIPEWKAQSRSLYKQMALIRTMRADADGRSCRRSATTAEAGAGELGR